MSFTQNCFKTIAPAMIKIYALPFNKGLADGSLSRETFIHYLQQDSLYLIDYARAIASVAAKLTDERGIELMLQFSREALIGERELHTSFFKEYSVPVCTEKTPVCTAYTSFLLARAAFGSAEEGLAALLPCFWIYREVGIYFKKYAETSPYKEWINTYTSPEYSALVYKAVALTDMLASTASADVQVQMKKSFVLSTHYEYMFWDDAYSAKPWPMICN